MTDAKGQVEDRAALDAFYGSADPWNYDQDPSDRRRVAELLALIGHLKPERTLDIGCGNGFVTVRLPGRSVLGVDLSAEAIGHAERRVADRGDASRFTFQAASLFDLAPETIGRFDLIVITGVLYPQYIGEAVAVARLLIDALADPGCLIASCHVAEWNPPRLAHTLVDRSIYPYRDYFHLLEVVRT